MALEFHRLAIKANGGVEEHIHKAQAEVKAKAAVDEASKTVPSQDGANALKETTVLAALRAGCDYTEAAELSGFTESDVFKI